MAKVLPPKDFASASLEIHTVPAGLRFYGIYGGNRYPTLASAKRRVGSAIPGDCVPENCFGVLYLGETLKVCFLEAVLRDQRDGVVGDLPIEEKEIYARRYAEIEMMAPLKDGGSPRRRAGWSQWVFQPTWRRRLARV